MPLEIAELAGPALSDPATASACDALEEPLAAATDEERPVATVARLESTMYLRQQLLRDADVMSMAHGLELRVPFVDHHLVATIWPALGAHPRLLRGKRLLVDAVGARLPASVVSRPKRGFTLPFEFWIDGPLSDFVRDGLSAAAKHAWLAPSAPDTIWRAWKTRSCHWSRPWGLAVLGHFLHD
jgi:asparagine synthase (glutamine-hydrolysing)